MVIVFAEWYDMDAMEVAKDIRLIAAANCARLGEILDAYYGDSLVSYSATFLCTCAYDDSLPIIELDDATATQLIKLNK